MISPEIFLDKLETVCGVDCYAGVPDSLLQPLCDTLQKRHGTCGRHTVAANEGAAVGLAAGHYIATGHPAAVYMQNSGIGNAVNPVASLLNPSVYGIPCVFIVGWRGEPGVPDEPQHAYQGQITLELLHLLGMDVWTLDGGEDEASLDQLMDYVGRCLLERRCAAIVVRKGAFGKVIRPEISAPGMMTREEAIQCLLEQAGEDIIVSTTGKTSRELYEVRKALSQEGAHDFLTVGSMGHASMIAQGIAMATPERRVWCLDGDGAALMHLGSLVVEATGRCANLIHVIINNGAHESVGGMPVADGKTNFTRLALAAGFDTAFTVHEIATLTTTFQNVRNMADSGRTCFVQVLVRQGSRKALGRPGETPKENLQSLMSLLGSEKVLL